MWAFIAALASIWLRATSPSSLPTRRAKKMKRGSMATASRVRRHSSPSITTSTVAAPRMLATSETKVPVTACWAPTTSLFSRDISSPVLVLVKKPSDMPWRWSYSSRRRSKMTPSPMPAVARRCTTPTIPLVNGTATMPNPSTVTSARFFSGMAVSISPFISSGGTTVRMLMMTIVIRTTAISTL